MNKTKDGVIQILKEKIHCNCKDIEDNMDMPLTGSSFGLTDVDMVYLLFEVEKCFKIRIEEKDLTEYGFSTVNRIADIVESYQKNEKCICLKK